MTFGVYVSTKVNVNFLKESEKVTLIQYVRNKQDIIRNKKVKIRVIRGLTQFSLVEK